MNTAQLTQDRRDFLKTVAAGAIAASTPLASFAASAGQRRGIKLGYDNFAIRAMNWMVEDHIDYSAKLGCDSLFMSDIEHFKSYDEGYLNDVRKKAADKGLQIHVGTWSICPTSKAFRDNHGTAEEHLRLGIRVAKAIGSPVIRVVLGTGEDRKTEGGIMARIMDTVKVCKACRSQAIDSGVKIAVENHAGDMQAHEVVLLVEEAGGREYMGVNLDSGNAVWTMETPMDSLEILGPYAATTSLRDSSVWLSENGVTAQWTATGAGMVDWPKYFDRFAELCPGVPVHYETISGFNRELPIFRPEQWVLFPEMKAPALAHFLAWAKDGKPLEPWKAPAGQDRGEAEKEYQRAQIEESIRYCKSIGLGLKA
ncbi:TIM barrel protein [bacterium]|nr:TIM barrel protein [bacterium]